MDCFKIGKGVDEVVYCHPAYLTSMQSTSCKMPGWMTHKLESRFLGEISTSNNADDTSVMAESEEELKSFCERKE